MGGFKRIPQTETTEVRKVRIINPEQSENQLQVNKVETS